LAQKYHIERAFYITSTYSYMHKITEKLISYCLQNDYIIFTHASY